MTICVFNKIFTRKATRKCLRGVDLLRRVQTEEHTGCRLQAEEHTGCREKT